MATDRSDPVFQFVWKRGDDIPCDITWCRTIDVENDTFVADYSKGLKLFSYTAVTDNWAYLLDKSCPPTVFFGMGDFRDKFVMVGGKDVQTNECSGLVTEWRCTDMEFFHPYPPMVSPRVDPLVVGWGDYLIVAGGIVDDSAKQTIEIFNADKDVFAWKIVGELPVSTTLSCAVTNETLYLLGDHNNLFKTSLPKLVSCAAAKGSSGEMPTWELVTETQFKESTIFSFHNHLLIAGGCLGSGTPVSDIMRFNEEDGKWVKVGDLPQPCFGCSCVWMTKPNVIFVMGGKNNHDEPLLLKGVYKAHDVLQE